MIGKTPLGYSIKDFLRWEPVQNIVKQIADDSAGKTSIAYGRDLLIYFPLHTVIADQVRLFEAVRRRPGLDIDPSTFNSKKLEGAFAFSFLVA